MGTGRGSIKGEFRWPGTFHDECLRCSATLKTTDTSDEGRPIAIYECGRTFAW